MNTYLTTEMLAALMATYTPFKHETGLRSEVVGGNYLIFNKENRLVYWQSLNSSSSPIHIELRTPIGEEFRKRHPLGVVLARRNTCVMSTDSVAGIIGHFTAYARPMATEVPVGVVFDYNIDEHEVVLREFFNRAVMRATLKKAVYKGQQLFVSEVVIREPEKFTKSRKGLVYVSPKDKVYRGSGFGYGNTVLKDVIYRAFSDVPVDCYRDSFAAYYAEQQGYKEKLEEALKYEVEQEEQERQRQAAAAEAQAAEATEG